MPIPASGTLGAAAAAPHGDGGRAAPRCMPLLRERESNLSFFPTRDGLMKPAAAEHLAVAPPPRGAFQSEAIETKRSRRNLMSSKKVVRKPSKKIADTRRVRYGSGAAPRVLRAGDAATKDSRAIRFGSGAAPAALRK